MRYSKRLLLLFFVMLFLPGCGKQVDKQNVEPESNGESIENLKERIKGESLDEAFEKFHGQWIINVERGAVIGIETKEESPWLFEENPDAKWVIWETGGDTMYDTQVIDYDDNSITFECESTWGSGVYYYILNYYENDGVTSVGLAYGQSLDDMEEMVSL